MIEFSGFSRLGQKKKFLALYPNGYEKGWHDGRIAPKVEAFSKK